jgi:exoribonuclease R
LKALVGRSSGKAYHLGDQLRVRLDRIEREGNKLQFSLVG